MIALLSPGGAFRDVFLAGGLGLLLGLFYCMLKAIFSTKRRAFVFACDILTFMFAALMFRSAAAGVFEGGIMRWYTALSAVLLYMLCVNVVMAPVLKKVKVIKAVVLKPILKLLNVYILPFLMGVNKKIILKYSKIRKKHTKTKKNNKRHLQKETKMLYNS